MLAKYRSVLMVQVNYHYGSNVFIPYSVGSLQAYAQVLPEVRESFEFQKPLFFRHNPIEVVKNIEQEPAIVGLSSYLWNWEYNKILAQTLRAAFPKCLIIFGGTQVPDASEGFFVQHPYIDLLVHHEGELTFSKILLEFLRLRPDYTRIPGLSVRVEGDRTFKTPPSERIKDLSQLPSPYLAGVFDFMVDRQFVLNASQETNRGCPYSCTFCDWGGSTYAKLFDMDEARIIEEFEWFGGRKVEYLFNCDANYGIRQRDLGLTEKMIAARAKYGGCPRKFRMCTAKNSNDKIFSIAKMLNAAGMAKGATLSFQSMDESTLLVVKRSNIKLGVFTALMDRYREEGIPTYTELIMGMPGETYESTKRGIDRLIDGQDDTVNIFAYICSVLPNSEMSHPIYVQQHKIRWVRMPILLAHSTPEPESLPEYQDVVVETAAMSNEDWKRIYLFYWAIQTFHCLGLLQCIAILFRKGFGIRYSDFYEKLIEYFTVNKNTFVGEQIALVREIVARSIEGGRLDLVMPRFGEIYWPLEEASFLTLVVDKEKFYKEIRSFIQAFFLESAVYLTDNDLLDDALCYQEAVAKDPYASEVSVKLRYDFRDYYTNLKFSTTPARLNSPVELCIKAQPCFSGDLERYAREVVWYGRKSGRFHYSDITCKVI